MPCYIFTYHARGSWLPDHRRGYVRRGQGIQASDPNLANAYRANMQQQTIEFSADMQRILVAAARESGIHLKATIHAVATEPTHVHVHLSWKHDRLWKSMRSSIRSAMSRSMNAAFTRRDWFASSPSRKRVRSYSHFDHLMLTYWPKHRGLVWRREQSVRAAERRRESGRG